MATLPSIGELRKLTLRALAAYAARCARRGSQVLRGVIADEIIEAPLRIIERLASVNTIDSSEHVTICYAAAGVANAMSAVPPGSHRASLCLSGLEAVVGGICEAARNLLLDAANPERARGKFERGLGKAVKIAEWAVPVEGPTEEVVAAARHDYEVLLQTCGEQSAIVIGEPIDLLTLFAKE